MNPETREEFYLAKMAGEDVTLPEPVTREEQYMEKVAERIDEAGSELPKVSDYDDGKVLTVSSGKWAAVAPTNLRGYNVTIATHDGDSLASDVRFADLVDQMLAGHPISGSFTYIAEISEGEYAAGVFPLNTIELASDVVTLIFSSFNYDEGLFQTYFVVTLDSSNHLTLTDSGEIDIPLGS